MEVEGEIICLRNLNTHQNRFIIAATKEGKVFIINDETQEAILFIDMKQEQKDFDILQGFEFHPKFDENGKVYMHYSLGLYNEGKKVIVNTFDHLEVVEEWRMVTGCLDKHFKENNICLKKIELCGSKNKVSFKKVKTYLIIRKMFSDYRSFDSLKFIPDNADLCSNGELSLCLDDGGKQMDPYNNASNKKSLLGKIWALDCKNGKKNSYSRDKRFYCENNYEQSRTDYFVDYVQSSIMLKELPGDIPSKISLICYGVSQPSIYFSSLNELTRECSNYSSKSDSETISETNNYNQVETYILDKREGNSNCIFRLTKEKEDFGWRSCEGSIPTLISSKDSVISKQIDPKIDSKEVLWKKGTQEIIITENDSLVFSRTLSIDFRGSPFNENISQVSSDWNPIICPKYRSDFPNLGKIELIFPKQGVYNLSSEYDDQIRVKVIVRNKWSSIGESIQLPNYTDKDLAFCSEYLNKVEDLKRRDIVVEIFSETKEEKSCISCFSAIRGKDSYSNNIIYCHNRTNIANDILPGNLHKMSNTIYSKLDNYEDGQNKIYQILSSNKCISLLVTCGRIALSDYNCGRSSIILLEGIDV